MSQEQHQQVVEAVVEVCFDEEAPQALLSSGQEEAERRPARQLVLRTAPASRRAIVVGHQHGGGGCGEEATAAAVGVEREVPLACLVGWGATNVGINLNLGPGVPGLFFATQRASEISDVLLRTLATMRDERERGATAAAGEEDGNGGDEAPQVTLSIESVRPVPPYAGTK